MSISKYKAVWTIDYGTTTVTVLGHITQEVNDDLIPPPNAILSLQGFNRSLCPQVVGYVRQDNVVSFVWGDRVSEKRRHALTNTSISVICFERLKVAILGVGKESDAATTRIQHELDAFGAPEKTVEDLFVRHLEALKPAVPSAFLNVFAAQHSFWTCEQAAELPVEVIFAVPEIADVGKLHTLVRLLKKAEFPRTTLVPEGEAAGAWHVPCHQ